MAFDKNERWAKIELSEYRGQESGTILLGFLSPDGAGGAVGNLVAAENPPGVDLLGAQQLKLQKSVNGGIFLFQIDGREVAELSKFESKAGKMFLKGGGKTGTRYEGFKFLVFALTQGSKMFQDGFRYSAKVEFPWDAVAYDDSKAQQPTAAADAGPTGFEDLGVNAGDTEEVPF